MFRLGFIGGGQMAEALIRGMQENASELHLEYLLYDPALQRRRVFFDRYSVESVKGNGEVMLNAAIVFLAVKPQMYPSIQEEIARYYKDGKILVSIMAGVDLDTLGANLPANAKIVRLMPNGAMAIGKGICLYADNGNLTESERTWILDLLSTMGMVKEMPEGQINAAMSVASCSPAVYYTILDAMILGGIAVGLSKELSLELAAQSMLGSAALLMEKKEHPAILRDQVLSPAGTTIEAVKVLEAAGVRSALIDGVEQAYWRAEEMAKGGHK